VYPAVYSNEFGGGGLEKSGQAQNIIAWCNSRDLMRMLKL
jgi:hypothetical protein